MRLSLNDDDQTIVWAQIPCFWVCLFCSERRSLVANDHRWPRTVARLAVNIITMANEHLNCRDCLWHHHSQVFPRIEWDQVKVSVVTLLGQVVFHQFNQKVQLFNRKAEKFDKLVVFMQVSSNRFLKQFFFIPQFNLNVFQPFFPCATLGKKNNLPFLQE